ncbi:MAG: hypothetical protein V1774_00310 [Candidatus Eisenbacteria bacterium]
MPLIKEHDKAQISELLDPIVHDVKLVFFTQNYECQYCELTRQLVDEVAALSPKITVETHDFKAEAELAAKLGIDKIPAIAVMGERDYRIRFYGIPAGYEFPALLEAIVDVGMGTPALPDPLLAEVAKIDQPVHLQVMVTPT